MITVPLMKKCNEPGCVELIPKPQARCDRHRRQADRRRGTAAQRGYGREHRARFRPGVLARNPICVICFRAPAVVADHYPMSRRELVDAGLDPNDPQYGRGLCIPCHSRETAENQPGGWNDRRSKH
ncbi:hypothetical protein NQ036_06855 [Brevibacterium sp. 91QC2O2]|uniref:hypothetical protein n=1 Tax=Brevibacterium sp. 91QC2O2 TaxID=2968458 RepID=UPI00211C060A|nr:hypothetical protein [Brevibacterium sp. 91QC2O2]MCQ9367963.1 hypothetical protein [Brevibacterium sp. 91QC2O2]